MFGSKSVNYQNERKFVGRLFFLVLTEKMTISEALTKFPKDCSDKTITASWHALCHLEADEDLRAKDSMYKEVQDEYIEYIAHTLEKGEELPNNIIKSYKPYHNEALFPNSETPKGIWHTLKKFLNV